MKYTVDVIVPCYRYGKYLRQCVESVTNQSEVESRVLIIDDASPDDTSEVAEELTRDYENVQFYKHPANKGHIATYNEGIEWTSAQSYLLLSADDYLLPGSLGRAARLLADNPGVGFAFGSATVLFEDGSTENVNPLLGKRRITDSKSVVDGSTFVVMSGARNIVPTPTAVIRTALQKQVGGYLQHLPHSADMEMWMRLATHASVGFINDYQAVYRRHTSNMSLAYAEENILLDFGERRRVLEIFYERQSPTGNSTSVRRALSRDLAIQAIKEASSAFNHGKIELSREILKFAIDLYPNCRQSLPWLKLSMKQAVGENNWRALATVRKLF